MDLDEQTREANQLRATAGPAFLRRARRVDDSWNELRTRATQERRRMLEMVGLRAATLRALAGSWEALAARLPELPVEDVRRIDDECRGKLRLPPEPTDSPGALTSAWTELRESVARFNRRWRSWLDEVDLQPINRCREEYNRYYVLEKECVVGSPRIARQGFRPLPPLSVADLLAQFPPLPSLDRNASPASLDGMVHGG